MSATTRSCVISFVTAFEASSGRLWLSSTSSWMERPPSTPPALLISSTASCAPSSDDWPNEAPSPVSDAYRPTRMSPVPSSTVRFSHPAAAVTTTPRRTSRRRTGWGNSFTRTLLLGISRRWPDAGGILSRGCPNCQRKDGHAGRKHGRLWYRLTEHEKSRHRLVRAGCRERSGTDRMPRHGRLRDEPPVGGPDLGRHRPAVGRRQRRALDAPVARG